MQLGVVISKILERIKYVFSKLSNSICRINISRILVSENKNVILICDSLIASISLLISIQLRIGIDFFDSYILLLNNIIVFGLVSASTFIWFKINNKLLINKLLLSIIASNIIFIPLMYFMDCNIELPFSLLIINIFVMSFILIGLKYIDYNLHNKLYTLLIGDSESILLFLKLHEDRILDYFPDIRIINTNPYIDITTNSNIPVLGNINDISNILELNKVNQVIITNNDLPDYDKNMLFNLSKQYKFIIVQNYIHSNKSEVI